MIHYRPFLNTDSPFVVDVWRQQPPFRGLFSALTRELLDQQVFAKPYFDRNGLILAFEGPETSSRFGERARPLGFVHAGFAPDETLNDLDRSIGVLSQLKVIPGERASEVGIGLLNQAFDYLKKNGAVVAHGGGHFPHAPFYQGLYGGSRIPGVLDADQPALDLMRQFGFQTQEKILVLHRKLAGFRAVIDRDQMSLRRQFQIKAIPDPLETSWWESCTFSLAERDRFTVFNKTKREYVGAVSFWDMQPLASELGTVCRGLYDLKVNADLRRSGMATYLVGEALRHLMQNGVGQVEAQVRESDTASLGVFQKLGFEQVAFGHLLSKEIQAQSASE